MEVRGSHLLKQKGVVHLIEGFRDIQRHDRRATGRLGLAEARGDVVDEWKESRSGGAGSAKTVLMIC